MSSVFRCSSIVSEGPDLEGFQGQRVPANIFLARGVATPSAPPGGPGFVEVVAGFGVFQRDRSSALFVHQIHQLPGNVTALL